MMCKKFNYAMKNEYRSPDKKPVKRTMRYKCATQGCSIDRLPPTQ